MNEDLKKYCVVCNQFIGIQFVSDIDLTKTEAEIVRFNNDNNSDYCESYNILIQDVETLGEHLMSQVYKIRAFSILKPETCTEDNIMSEYDFYSHICDGEVRRGHPEGAIVYHIKEVFDNIDKYNEGDNERYVLREIALVHDSFKYKVDRSQPRVGDNHHGAIAKNFAMKFINELRILLIIETHDDAYNAWNSGSRNGDWKRATSRALDLIRKLIVFDALDLYVKFYKCDNETGDKTQECLKWFIDLIKEYKERAI
jgi:hypothetical protein